MLSKMRVVLSIAAIFSLSISVALAQQPEPEQLLNSAIEAQQRGDYQTAIRDYRKLLELRPDTVEAKVNLGAALVHVGDFDGAIAMYKSALPSMSQKNGVLRDLALAYYKKGDFQNANEQFEALHTAQPNDIRITILLGDTDVRLGKPATAVTLLEPLENANAHNLDFEYAYGFALIKAGKRRDGVERIEKVAKSGNSADSYLLAGSTRLDLNDFEAARTDLEAALRLDPKLPDLYTLLGTARDKTGDTANAEIAFREALKRNPDDFDANLYLGAILYKRRNLDEAKPYLDRALQLNPTSSMARYESAMLESTSGQYEVAAQHLEKLVKDDPNWLEPHIELASLYYRLHRSADGAREREIVDRLTADQQAQGPGKH
ncbi:MAG: tetratricopeptide repeat protein [Candidatus Sulfotelmatobacter sp.]|jgi:tetratricopeptide (TPR) repeat protein